MYRLIVVDVTSSVMCMQRASTIMCSEYDGDAESWSSGADSLGSEDLETEGPNIEPETKRPRCTENDSQPTKTNDAT